MNKGILISAVLLVLVLLDTASSPGWAQREVSLRQLQEAVQKNPNDPSLHYLLGVKFQNEGKDSKALAAYQRTLISGDSPFDRWYFGGDEAAVDEQVKRGFELFRGEAGCSACHLVGDQHALFTDSTFHNTGIGWRNSMLPRPNTTEVQLAPGVFVSVDTALIDAVGEPVASDLGLYEITQNPADRWRYKTPGLRNVDLTAPYMHDGSLPTLEAVVAFYNRGGVPHPLLDPRVRPLSLSTPETEDLVAFLRSLTGESVPRLVADAFAAPIGDLGSDDPHWSHDNRLEY